MSFLRNQNTMQLAQAAAQVVSKRGFSGITRTKLTQNNAIQTRSGGHHGPQVPGENIPLPTGKPGLLGALFVGAFVVGIGLPFFGVYRGIYLRGNSEEGGH